MTISYTGPAAGPGAPYPHAGTRSAPVLSREGASVGELEVGIHPGSAAYLDVSAKNGTVQNLMETADQPAPSEETVQVYARNSTFGNIIIRHATAV